MNRRAAAPYLLVLPSAVFLCAVLALPLVETVILAFRDGDAGWTLGYFAKMSRDANFSLSLRNTLLLAAVVVPLQVCLALAMGVALGKLHRGRGSALYLWALPLGISDLATGLVWLALLTERGFLPSLLYKIGVISGPASWLSYQTPGALFAAIVIAEIWRATPLVLIILVSGLEMIPKEFDEAGKVFGASPWQRFWHVTLPLIRPSLQTALILRSVMALEVFAVVFALAGRDFNLLVGEAYQWQYLYQNTHMAAAYAVVILALSAALTAFFLRLLRSPSEVVK
jgi:multiple sugar transport system permease protein